VFEDRRFMPRTDHVAYSQGEMVNAKKGVISVSVVPPGRSPILEGNTQC